MLVPSLSFIFRDHSYALGRCINESICCRYARNCYFPELSLTNIMTLEGWASAASTWRGYTWGCPYAAAVTNVKSLLFPDRAHTYASTQGGNSFPFLRQGRKLMYQSASYDHSSPFTWEWLRGEFISIIPYLDICMCM